jgi:hypothetical protein
MIRVLIETETFDSLKKKAKEENLSFSEFCRRKISEPMSLERLEGVLTKFYEDFKRSNKFNTGGKK